MDIDFTRLSRETCTYLLESVGGAVADDEPIEELREAVESGSKNGDYDDATIAWVSDNYN